MKQRGLQMLILTSLFVVSCIGCGIVRGPRGSILSSDPQKCKTKLLRAIPLETPVTEAEQMMKRAGFFCSMEDTNRFRLFDDMATPDLSNQFSGAKRFHPEQFLYCRKEGTAALPFCSATWQFAFPYNDHRQVTNIFVLITITGT